MSKDIFLKKLGLRITALRKSVGLSQTELALRCDWDRQVLHKIEKGQVNTSVYNMYLIAAALEISLPELMRIKED